MRESAALESAVLALASLLILILVVSYTDSKKGQADSTTKQSPSTQAEDATEQSKKQVTSKNYGTKLSDSKMESKAKSYVESKFVKTYGGYDITSYTFGSISKGGNDDENIYQYYTVYGTYSFKDKYGRIQTGKTFEYPVKVYQWSSNPDGYPAVSAYY